MCTVCIVFLIMSFFCCILVQLLSMLSLDLIMLQESNTTHAPALMLAVSGYTLIDRLLSMHCDPFPALQYFFQRKM